MIAFIPAPAAEALSIALWSLSRPPQAAQLNETKFLFDWVDDLQGNRWLRVDTEFSLYVHTDAVLNGIADILQPWIERGQLPVDTNEQLAALVESRRGQKLVVYDAFPAFFKEMAQTQEQMIAAGLLAQHSDIP